MMNGDPRGKNSFTLIELLVVVAIIAVLISILLPALGAARHQARMVLCGNNLRQIMIGCLNYAQQENEFLPPNAATSQGEMDPGATAGRFYGPPVLVKANTLEPKVLYSVEDQDFDAKYWPTPYVPPYHVWFSFTFREPNSAGFQQCNPTGGIFSYSPPFKINQVNSFAADKFTGNHVISFHKRKGSANIANEIWGGNGEGWHVGFIDGHVGFRKNDPFVYRWGSSVGAAGGWTNRHLNWIYWDGRE
jgi:prepilin-type N-terminal cleavage/methylation domain-containing protein